MYTVLWAVIREEAVSVGKGGGTQELSVLSSANLKLLQKIKVY